ncbi:MAG: hypothetical protein J6128_00175 [Clostridia bacterium]|nr:hypothetical protein [Clostridia bacterium]
MIDIKIKRIIPLMLVLALLFLSSCDGMQSALMYIGIDLHDYDSEETIRTLRTFDDECAKLKTILEVIIQDTTEIREFNGFSEAANYFTDEILTFLTNTRFSKYNGNVTLMNELEKEYPGLFVTTIIPASDFDTALQKYFGAGSSVPHPSGTLFRYMKKVNMYITEVQPPKPDTEITVISCEETENTYRMIIEVSADDQATNTYRALFAKRKNSDPYFRSLKPIDE